MKWRWLLPVFVFLGTWARGADDSSVLHEPLKTVAGKYLVIQQKLASDSFAGIPETAAAMKTAMTAPGATFDSDFTQAVGRLAASSDLHSARMAFQDVSKDFIAALAQSKAQTGTLHALFCPMIKAYWVQSDPKKVENPYYGPAMLDCGAFQGVY